MADVRSLLRHEQASRRITHPHLAYTKSGLLNCLICNLIIKSESLWEGHLKSPNHKKHVQKAQTGDVQDVTGTGSKKRKMSDEGEDVRKKRKSTSLEDSATDQAVTEAPRPAAEALYSIENGQRDVAGPEIPGDDRHPTDTSATLPPPNPVPPPPIDEDEWAAFEREVVPLAQPNPSADYTAATISAAPVSAAELAAQTHAERQQRREAGVEEEKAEEEARLVEEFEVMEGLEERVKRLKEKREALRIGAVGERVGVGGMDVDGPEKELALDADEGESDSDEGDDWGFV